MPWITFQLFRLTPKINTTHIPSVFLHHYLIFLGYSIQFNVENEFYRRMGKFNPLPSVFRIVLNVNWSFLSVDQGSKITWSTSGITESWNHAIQQFGLLTRKWYLVKYRIDRRFSPFWRPMCVGHLPQLTKGTKDKNRFPIQAKDTMKSRIEKCPTTSSR